MKSRFSVQRMTRIAVVAAAYVALTLLLSFFAYGDIQFRVSEMLMLLCFFNPDYGIALSIGCVISNCFSPFAVLDVPVGTAATVLAACLMWKSRRLWVASLYPVLCNAVLVGLELSVIYGLPMLATMGSVAIGEFTVVTVVGLPVFSLLRRNPVFMRAIQARDHALR